MANQRARRLRANMTDAGRRPWWRLRGRQLGGHRLRRQVPLGPYIVDFACLAEPLAALAWTAPPPQPSPARGEGQQS